MMSRIRGIIERLNDLEGFQKALQGVSTPMAVVMETPEKTEVFPDQQPSEVMKCFQEGLQRFPYHLHFRAFNETLELAWYGSIGALVRLEEGGGEGLEVDDKIEVKGEGGLFEARCQALKEGGRIVYLKLREIKRG